MSASALAVLITAMAMIDERVGNRLAPGEVWNQVTHERREVSMMSGAVYEVVSDHSRLAMFVVAASVLVVCMLRT